MDQDPKLEFLSIMDRKRKWYYAWLSVVVLAGLVWGYFSISHQKEVAQAHDTLAVQSEVLESTRQTVASLDSFSRAQVHPLARLEQARTMLAHTYKPEDLIECVAYDTLPQRKDAGGLHYYYMTLAVKDPTVLSKLRSVGYYFNHPTFVQKLMVGSNPANHYQVGYIGWGCIENVMVYLHFKDASTDTVHYPMCNYVTFRK